LNHLLILPHLPLNDSAGTCDLRMRLRCEPAQGFDQLAEKLNETAALSQKRAEVLEAAMGRNMDLALPKYPSEPLADWRIPFEAHLPEPIFSETLFKDAFAELKQMATELMALHRSVRQALPIHWSRDWKFWLPVIIAIASLAFAIFKH
jgi:hypothetical protein